MKLEFLTMFSLNSCNSFSNLLLSVISWLSWRFSSSSLPAPVLPIIRRKSSALIIISSSSLNRHTDQVSVVMWAKSTQLIEHDTLGEVLSYLEARHDTIQCSHVQCNTHKTQKAFNLNCSMHVVTTACFNFFGLLILQEEQRAHQVTHYTHTPHTPKPQKYLQV